MINLIQSGIIILTATTLGTGYPTVETGSIEPVAKLRSTQNTDAALLNQLYTLGIKQLRASGIAATQGGTQVKDWGNRLSLVLSKFNDELRLLAKSRSIVLTGALPEGGQRPDGRVDSSPENLRDTSRIKNGGGEAGNNGAVKTKAIGINDEANNALVESLKKLNGSAFDLAYKNLLKSDRQTAEKLLDQASASTDANIATFAKKYRSMLMKAKR